MKTSPSGRLEKSSHQQLGSYNFSVNQVLDGLRDHDVELFFPETTTYTAVNGDVTPPQHMTESLLSCPRRMTLTRSGRLCFAYAIDLS